MSKRMTTLYLSKEPYENLKQLAFASGRSVSQLVNELISDYLAEHGGQPTTADKTVDYERLKRVHSRLVREVDKLEKRLMKRKVYQKLADCAVAAGVNLNDLSNLPQHTGEMLRKWDGLSEDMHQFITLLETVHEKREVERKLLEIRAASLAGL